MVDGTPVLDIKPYIPIYDQPMAENGTVDGVSTNLAAAAVVPSVSEFFNSPREEPDGEESDDNILGHRRVATNVVVADTATVTRPVLPANVRVPDWVLAEPTLKVAFNERAAVELQEIGVDRVKGNIFV